MPTLPIKCGVNQNHPRRILERDLIQSFGSSLSGEENENLRAKYAGYGRMLYSLFSTNIRMANELDPASTIEFLDRWERIYGLSFNAFLNKAERRDAIVNKRLLSTSIANNYSLYLLCQQILGEAFVSMQFYTPAESAASGSATVPGGVVPSNGGTAYDDGDFRTQVARIRVIVAPGSLPPGVYAQRWKRFERIALDFMPAWVQVQTNQAGGFKLGISKLGLDGFDTVV